MTRPAVTSRAVLSRALTNRAVPRERGMVTAEAAMVLPVLVCLTLALAWTVLLGVAQVRVVDAAREAARLTARGEDAATVDAAVTRLAPGAARWSASDRAGLVVVQVSTRVQPQVPLVGGLGGVTLSAEAAAAEETP